MSRYRHRDAIPRRRGPDDSEINYSLGIARHCARGYDSEGNRLPPVEDWVYMHINETVTRSPDSYEPVHYWPDIVAAADLSRKWSKLSTLHRSVLATYDGDVGKHWENIFEGSRKIACLFPLTEIGAKAIKRAGGGKAPDRVIEQMYRDQDSGIEDEERDTELRLMEHQAWPLLFAAREEAKKAGIRV